MSPAAASAARSPVALYIHVPFCVSLCPYCDFVVIAGSAARGPRNRIGQFLDALHVELGLRADALDRAFGAPGTRRRPPLESVYLGGGTPSLIPTEQIERLLGRVRERFGLADDAEVTIEANPGPDERGDPAALHRAGITRLSFGAQSLRRHGASQARAAPSGTARPAMPSRRPARRASGRSTSTSSTTSRTPSWRPGWPPSTRRWSSSPTTCRCMP